MKEEISRLVAVGAGYGRGGVAPEGHALSLLLRLFRCGIAYDSFVSLVQQGMGRVSSTVLWASLRSLDTRYVGHSRKAFEKWAGTPDMLADTPNDLLVTCCETNLRESPEIWFDQASSVNGTKP